MGDGVLFKGEGNHVRRSTTLNIVFGVTSYWNYAMLHSKLCSIMLVATKVDVILRIFVVLTYMCDKRKLQ